MIVNTSNSFLLPQEGLSVETPFSYLSRQLTRAVFEALRPNSIMHHLSKLVVTAEGARSHEFLLTVQKAISGRVTIVQEGQNSQGLIHEIIKSRHDVLEFSLSKLFSSRLLQLSDNYEFSEEMAQVVLELQRDLANVIDEYTWLQYVSQSSIHHTSIGGVAVAGITGVTKVSSEDLMIVSDVLRENNCRAIEEPIAVSPNISTVGLSHSFVLVCHTRLREQFLALEDFVPSSRYSNPVQVRGSYELGYISKSQLRVQLLNHDGLIGDVISGTSKIYKGLILTKDVGCMRAVATEVLYGPENYLESQSAFRHGIMGQVTVDSPGLSPANVDLAIGLIANTKCFFGAGLQTTDAAAVISMASDR